MSNNTFEEIAVPMIRRMNVTSIMDEVVGFRPDVGWLDENMEYAEGINPINWGGDIRIWGQRPMVRVPEFELSGVDAYLDQLGIDNE